MDKGLITRRFSRAAASYEKEAAVQRRIAATMTELLIAHVPVAEVERLLEIGCGTGIFSRMLHRTFSPSQMYLNDLCPEMANSLTDLTDGNVRFLPGDAEKYAFHGKYNLIASCSTLQWFKDLKVFFAKIHALLPDDGVFAFSTFGKDNLKEIKTITGQGLSYLSLQELRSLLYENYEIVHASEEHVRKTFRTPMEVLYHLKRTGVTGISQPQPWTRERLQRFYGEYNRMFAVGGLLPLTYHPIYIIAKRRM
ncbi:MAG: malonyl-ACP O-methyltransferase BioC [Tannerellaceae bacterium]|jgi:malonyl-ACP O-methyltransferase BioC|nr:malonyl-ACP O-methyltransferase BioC [Tannerellaceae bacterium]